MADIKVKTTKLNQNAIGEVTFSSATSSDTIVFDYDGAGDNKLVMLFKGAGNIVVKKGDAIQGVVNLTGSTTTEGALWVDSGAFKNVTGTYKGKVTATVSANTNVALIQLP